MMTFQYQLCTIFLLNIFYQGLLLMMIFVCICQDLMISVMWKHWMTHLETQKERDWNPEKYFYELWRVLAFHSMWLSYCYSHSFHFVSFLPDLKYLIGLQCWWQKYDWNYCFSSLSFFLKQCPLPLNLFQKHLDLLG